MLIGGRNFERGHTHIMGILNITPDSFSDGGRFNRADLALSHTLSMIEDGAEIIDIGGESTRPGYTEVSEDEEIERVCPVIELLKRETDVPLSLDTCKSRVALAGISAGADMINDIWGLKYDPEMAGVIASSKLPCCLMHNRDSVKAPYTDFIPDMLADMRRTLEIAANAEIQADRIILDPGIGFGKSCGQNLQAINNLDKFSELGFPVLLGASRKSVIGLTLGLPADERVEGTVATSVIAAMSRCMFVRVHDVKENYRAVKMAEAVINS
ncbi:MAG: dihydropteroate synthase [Butyrivibrio sp.]|nr:dihydropteroate synthase [Butyrivibrio sp.]